MHLSDSCCLWRWSKGDAPTLSAGPYILWYYKVLLEEMKVDKNKLVCDACEYAKHKRTSYVSHGLWSTSSFVLIHSETSHVVSISGMKYFITFIDCYSRMTWIYLMKHRKNKVLSYFKDFYVYIRNCFSIIIQIIRMDNVTGYVKWIWHFSFGRRDTPSNFMTYIM
jgi:hypothetical protein